MSRNHSEVSFHYVDTSFYFPKRTLVKDLISSLFKRERIKLDSISFIFCTDEYLLSINQQYLKHDTYTDIITFQISGASEPILSDVYISIERVKENAKDLSIPFMHELIRVIAHGALHLCGYKDKTKAEKKVMRSKEDFYINRYFNAYR